MKIKFEPLNAIGNIVFSVYLILIINYYVIGVNEVFYNYFRIFLNLIAFVLIMCKYKTNEEKVVLGKELVIFLLLTLLGIYSSGYNNNASVSGYLFATLSSFGITLLFVRFRIPSKIVLMIWFYYLILFLIYFVLNNGEMYFFMAKGGQSRNYISVMILTITGLFFLSKQEKIVCKEYILIALTDLLVCILSIGRGGILASFLILVGGIWVWLFTGYEKKSFVYKFIVVVVMASIFLVLFWTMGYLEKLFGGFVEYGIESNRIDLVWKPYLQKMSMYKNVLFGANYVDEIGRYNHLHNSFLMLHARYGVFGLFMILYCIARSVFCLKKNNNFLMLFFVIAYLIRAITDSMLGFSYCDIALFSIMFIYIEKSSGMEKK